MLSGRFLFQASPSHLSICVSDYLSPDAAATFFQVESAHCYFLPGFANISRSLLQPLLQACSAWKWEFLAFRKQTMKAVG